MKIKTVNCNGMELYEEYIPSPELQEEYNPDKKPPSKISPTIIVATKVSASYEDSANKAFLKYLPEWEAYKKATPYSTLSYHEFAEMWEEMLARELEDKYYHQTHYNNSTTFTITTYTNKK